MSEASRAREKESVAKFNATTPDWVKNQLARQTWEDGKLFMEGSAGVINAKKAKKPKPPEGSIVDSEGITVEPSAVTDDSSASREGAQCQRL